jgi:hypothetical protein
MLSRESKETETASRGCSRFGQSPETMGLLIGTRLFPVAPVRQKPALLIVTGKELEIDDLNAIARRPVSPSSSYE